MRATLLALIILLPVAVGSCHTAASPPAGPSASVSPSVSSSVSPSDRAMRGDWRPLFDGRSLDAWRGYRSQTIPNAWHIANGTLAKEMPVGDIVSRDEFGDFELELEWRIGEAGNSGIFYRGTEEYDHIYWTAPEYQLLDDLKAEDGKQRITSAGAVYGLYPSPPGHLKPVGEWNKTRIVARGAHIEHWLNEVKLLEYELWSPDWEAKVKRSKFGAWPNYGRAKKGHIALQGDHQGTLAFRNIRIRDLN